MRFNTVRHVAQTKSDMRQLEGLFSSMGAKQAADEKREMSQLCESHACEHREETETAEEDKQTSRVRVMENKRAELPVITQQHWLVQFQGHFPNSITTLETSSIWKHEPRKSTQARTLYLEMTLQCSPGLWSFSQMCWCVGPRG